MQVKIRSFLMTGIILLIVSFSSMSFANSISKQLLKAADTKSSGNYVRKRFVSLMNKPFDTEKNQKKILIIGDSHAQDFVNMIFESHNLSNYQISTRSIPTRCQPVLGGNATKFIAAKDKSFCAKSDSLAKAKPQIAQADIVIIAANWTENSAKELSTTINHLQLSKEQKLFIIGRKSFGKVSVRAYLRQSDQALRNLRNKVDAKQQKINTIMKSAVSTTQFIDMQKLICDSSANCRVFSSDLKLISFDGGHLTQDGAKYLGNILFRDSQLNQLK